MKKPYFDPNENNILATKEHGTRNIYLQQTIRGYNTKSRNGYYNSGTFDLPLMCNKSKITKVKYEYK